MTRFGLGGTPETLRQREAVCALVRWHMRPTRLLDREKPGRAARQMAAMGELAPEFTLERLARADGGGAGRVDLRVTKSPV